MHAAQPECIGDDGDGAEAHRSARQHRTHQEADHGVERLPPAPDRPGGTAVISVIVQPLIYWLWIGGGVMAFGTVLAAYAVSLDEQGELVGYWRRRRYHRNQADED